MAEALPDGRIRLADGRELASADLWPIDLEGGLVERLARGDVDSPADFADRLAALRLLELRRRRCYSRSLRPCIALAHHAQSARGHSVRSS